MIFEEDILKLHPLISVKIGVAPSRETTSAVETNVNETVITASPGPIPLAINGNNKASVPEEHEIACFTFTYSANLDSSSLISGPMIYFP